MRFAWISLFTFLFISALHSATSLADPTINTSISASEITLDSTLQFKIEAEWPIEEGNYRFGFPPLPLENLETQRQGESQETLFKDGRKWLKKIFLFELKPVKEGPASVQSFGVIFTDSGTNRSGSKQIPPTNFTVKPEPLKISPLVFIAVGFVLSLIVVCTFYFRIKASKAASKTDESRTLDEASRIEALTFEKPEVDVIQLSKIFGEFLQKKYELTGSQMTDSEIMSALQKKDLIHDDQVLIQELLTGIHEAKFMGTQASKSELNLLRNKTAYFIKGKQSTVISAIHT